MKAIPTIYRGIKYRSRLEARWAAFFSQLGWEHTYEPFDGDGYIPDFLIHTDELFLVEVKPAVTSRDYNEPWQKINDGLAEHWQGAVFLTGVSPLPGHSWESEWAPTIAGEMSPRETSVCDECCSAYFHEHGRVIWEDWDYDLSNRPSCEHWRWFWGRAFDPPRWVLNDKNDIVLQYYGSYGVIRCAGRVEPELREHIKMMWADACNAVQWRAVSM